MAKITTAIELMTRLVNLGKLSIKRDQYPEGELFVITFTHVYGFTFKLYDSVLVDGLQRAYDNSQLPEAARNGIYIANRGRAWVEGEVTYQVVK